MRLFSILFLFLACGSVSINGQYKAPALRHLTGNVKECRISSQNSVTKQFSKSKFSSDGKLKTVLMSYDENNLPYGWNSTFADSYSNFKVEWTKNNQPFEIKFQNKNAEGTQDLTIHYFYDGSSLVPDSALYTLSSNNIKSGRQSNTVNSCRYSDYEFDSHGNWIRRRVSQSEIDEHGEVISTTDYTETQKIKYY